jgi:hypothetical protein
LPAALIRPQTGDGANEDTPTLKLAEFLVYLERSLAAKLEIPSENARNQRTFAIEGALKKDPFRQETERG